MSNDLRQLIKESIRFELNVAEVYFGFHHRFSEDSNFWWKLLIEEKNHAALLMSGKEYFLDAGMFPSELVGSSLATLKNLNGELERLIGQEKESPMSRSAAFNLAIDLEDSAGEIDFQHAMHETGRHSKAIGLFQSLNEFNLDHADRIRSYMRQNGIDGAQAAPLPSAA
ncbi:MAG: hypothetical protein PHD04_04625 [Candidatus Pacebacteria bacterium]|nr:hypothetical protein [Candidatus Paceibacterota bacterium]